MFSGVKLDDEENMELIKKSYRSVDGVEIT